MTRTERAAKYSNTFKDYYFSSLFSNDNHKYRHVDKHFVQSQSRFNIHIVKSQDFASFKMCGSRKNRGACGRRTKQAYTPIAVTLGKMAMDKYQQYQAQKNLQQPQYPQPRYIEAEREQKPASPTRNSIESDKHFEDVNAEVLKNAGIAPPSYDAVMQKGNVRRPESVISCASSSSSDDRETIFTPPTTVYGGDDGPAERGLMPQGRIPAFGEQGQMHGEWISKREMRKAHKAARKAEKWAQKARDRGYVF